MFLLIFSKSSGISKTSVKLDLDRSSWAFSKSLSQFKKYFSPLGAVPSNLQCDLLNRENDEFEEMLED